MRSQPRRIRDPEQVARARRRLAPPGDEAEIARLQEAFCDPGRLRIVQALSAEPLCVGDLAPAVERTQTATAQHLRVLRDVGLEIVDQALAPAPAFIIRTAGAAPQPAAVAVRHAVDAAAAPAARRGATAREVAGPGTGPGR